MFGLPVLSTITGPWPAIASAAGLSLLVAGSTWWITSRSYKLEISLLRQHTAEADAVNSKASLAQFQRDVGVIHAAALGFADSQATLHSTISTLTEAFNAEVAAHPTAPSCRPSAERVRILKAAIAAANSAARPESRSPMRPALSTSH